MVELNEFSEEDCSLSSARSGTSSPRFSLFKWFKRSPKLQHNSIKRDITIEQDNLFSSSDSADTFYSTATVRSFSFHPGNFNDEINSIDLSHHHNSKRIGPFGVGAVKINNNNENYGLNKTRTLPANALTRRRDITARYSLQTCTASFGSCSNVNNQRNHPGIVKRNDERGSVRRVHVRGKRRAPNPPNIRPRSLCEVERVVVVSSGKRKRRPAPKPPECISKKRDTGMDGEIAEFMKIPDNPTANTEVKSEISSNTVAEDKFKSENQSIFTDTLVLQGGLLLPRKEKSATNSVIIGGIQSTAMPRPWYKRSVFEQPNVSRDEAIASSASASPGSSRNHGNEGSLRHFFSRSDKSIKEKKRETKRQSGLSILTNISELDKEAAAIVQEEQARNRAAMILEASRLGDIEKRIEDNEEIVVQDMVNSAMENSPRRGTRALISKFNAIGNITKVTVNTSFFAKRDAAKGDATDVNWRRRSKFPEVNNGKKDLSKYFIQRQTSDDNQSNESRNVDDHHSATEKLKIDKNDVKEQQKIINDVTNRLSVLQNIVKNNSSLQPSRSSNSDNKTTKDTECTGKTLTNSPKLLNSKALKNRNTRTEKFDEVKTTSEVIQREFSQIFDEIDRQLNTSKFVDGEKHIVDDENLNKTDSSSQVSKVLDILVQAEHNNDRKHEKNDKSKLRINNDDRVTDLKEMLKEMKHSLPKRPKPKRVDNFHAVPSGSRLFEPLKVTAPPVVQIASSNSSKIDGTKQKVSSGVQTSGNLRRIDTSLLKDAIVPDKVEANTGIVRKTFHLMRPREFAAIEAIMTMKNNHEDNTYANVIEKSIYANAMVLPSRSRKIIPNSIIIDSKRREKLPMPDKHPALELFNATGIDAETDTMAHNMNTLAVNRLLRKLEGAIASGNHQQAAGLAKELAKLKIQCSVVRQKTKATDLLNVDMFIEDRLAHQGPIPLQLPITMTVVQLKEKIFNEFQIPTNVQRWIIGKKLADNDDATLQELNAIEGLPVFLYLAAPVLQIDKRTVAADYAHEDDKIEEVDEEEELVIVESEEESDEEVPQEEIIPEIIIKNQAEKREIEKNNEIEKGGEVGKKEENEKIDEKEEIKEEIEVAEAEVQNLETVNNSELKNSVNYEEGAVGFTEEAKMVGYNELIMLENCGLVPNPDAIECPICFVIYGPLEGVILRDCLHAFCRPCIKDHIKYCREAEVKCPYRDNDYTCDSTLQQREIKALVEPQVYEQHLAKSIAQAENNAGPNAFHCKTPDCAGWCIYDDNVNNFLCPVCDMTNCLTCRVIHNGKNCWEYQEDVRLSQETDHESKRTAAMLTEMLDRGEAMACPTCEVVLMKKWGCDWLRCSMCKTEICWVTRGPRWGPGGTGDTSGGCKCRLNGVKCHPRCNYCH